MKKKLICLLTLICLFVATLTSAVLVSADGNAVVTDDYHFTSSVTVHSHSEGGVFSADFLHANRVEMKLDRALDPEVDKYINIKGKVASQINRFNLYWYYMDGSNTREIIVFTGDSRALTTIAYDGSFEHHWAVDANSYNDNLDYIALEVYTDDSTSARNMELYGLAFDIDGTFSNWATPVGGGEVVDPTPDPDPEVPAGELTLGEIVAPDVATVSKNAEGEQVVTYSASAGWSTFDIDVKNYSADLTVFKAEFTPSTDTTICFAFGENNIDWSISHKLYAGGQKAVQEIDLTQFTLGAEFTLMMYIDAEVTVEAEKSVTFHSFEFINPTIGGGDVEEDDDGTFAMGEIVAPVVATVTKNAEGEQVVTYSESAGWSTFNIDVKNYDITNTIFKVEFTPSSDTTVCFAFGKDNIDWSIGHRLYAGGQKAVQEIDLTQFTMSEDFTLMFYLDAEVTVEAEKSVTFHSFEFKTPDPEPVGMHFAEPKFDALNGTAMAEGGYEITWTNDGSELWRKASFAVKNFDTDYDVLVVKMYALEGTNLGIYLNYNLVSGETVIATEEELRNHWQAEGLVTATGEIEMVFLLKAYDLVGVQVTGFAIYLDNPTGNYTQVEGARNAKIISYEFKKASEIDFEELSITANAKVADYTGEPIAVEATASANVTLKVEYEVLDTDGKMTWTTSAPSKAGTYNVRAVFMGSLTYDYTVATTTLTINKVQATVSEDEISINADTREITIPDGIVVSSDPDFTEGYEILNGDVIAYGQVLYIKRPADDNHFESAVVSMTFTRPTTPESSTPDSSTTQPGTSETPAPTPDPAPQDKGCMSSMAVGAELMIALFGAVVMFVRKRR